MKLYIARDKDGELSMYSTKPELVSYRDSNEKVAWQLPDDYPPLFDHYGGGCSGCIKLFDWMFPEITFENSPVELTLNL